MNQSKKLELSKETLRCLDDQDLTDVAGGGGGGTGGGGRTTTPSSASAPSSATAACAARASLCDVL